MTIAMTIQAQVERMMATGERNSGEIARALGIRPEYARACLQRAKRAAETGKKSSPAESRAAAARKRRHRERQQGEHHV